MFQFKQANPDFNLDEFTAAAFMKDTKTGIYFGKITQYRPEGELKDQHGNKQATGSDIFGVFAEYDNGRRYFIPITMGPRDHHFSVPFECTIIALNTPSVIDGVGWARESNVVDCLEYPTQCSYIPGHLDSSMQIVLKARELLGEFATQSETIGQSIFRYDYAIEELCGLMPPLNLFAGLQIEAADELEWFIPETTRKAIIAIVDYLYQGCDKLNLIEIGEELTGPLHKVMALNKPFSSTMDNPYPQSFKTTPKS